MAQEVSCPVDFITINENKARFTALNVLLLTIAFLWLQHWSIVAFLTIDFLLRAFNLGKYSLLNLLSEQELNLFGVGAKPTDQAPKRFAAKVGLIFFAAILSSTVFGFINSALVMAITVSTFAFLESFAGVCVGCYVYTFYTKIFATKNAIQKVNGI
jgi:Domain of unknown function (DUF4395)